MRMAKVGEGEVNERSLMTHKAVAFLSVVTEAGTEQKNSETSARFFDQVTKASQ